VYDNISIQTDLGSIAAAFTLSSTLGTTGKGCTTIEFEHIKISIHDR
jgi:hypothetical protein